MAGKYDIVEVFRNMFTGFSVPGGELLLPSIGYPGRWLNGFYGNRGYVGSQKLGGERALDERKQMAVGQGGSRHHKRMACEARRPHLDERSARRSIIECKVIVISIYVLHYGDAIPHKLGNFQFPSLL